MSVDTTELLDPATPRRRKASKEVRRQQLIDATIDTIARQGFSDTTLAKVSKEAGLSQGIVNLHFKSKDLLFEETLRYLREDYQKAWSTALKNAGQDPAERLMAVVAVDFDAPICAPRKLAVWFAFMGEAKSRPTYNQICSDRDNEYVAAIRALCHDLIQFGGYDHLDADVVAEMISSLGFGMWLDMLMGPKDMPRKRAREIMFTFLAQFFPDHIAIADAETFK